MSGLVARRAGLLPALGALWILACGGAASGAPVAQPNTGGPPVAEQPPARVLLRRLWRAGSIVRTSMTVHSSMPASPGTGAIVTMMSEQRVTNVDAQGTADVEEHEGHMALTSEAGQPIPNVVPGLDDVVFHYRVTSRGEILGRPVATGVTDANRAFVDGIVDSIVQASTPLPADPVGPGDPWTTERQITRTLPGGQSLVMMARSFWRLESLEATAAGTLAHLAVSIQIGSQPTQVMGMTMTASGDGTGATTYAVERGQPSLVHLDTNIHVAVRGGPSPVDVVMTMSMDASTM